MGHPPPLSEGGERGYHQPPTAFFACHKTVGWHETLHDAIRLKAKRARAEGMDWRIPGRSPARPDCQEMVRRNGGGEWPNPRGWPGRTPNIRNNKIFGKKNEYLKRKIPITLDTKYAHSNIPIT